MAIMAKPTGASLLDSSPSPMREHRYQRSVSRVASLQCASPRNAISSFMWASAPSSIQANLNNVCRPAVLSHTILVDLMPSPLHVSLEVPHPISLLSKGVALATHQLPKHYLPTIRATIVNPRTIPFVCTPSPPCALGVCLDKRVGP